MIKPNLIYKSEKPYSDDLNDLIEKGGVGSGIRGHVTADDVSDETKVGMWQFINPKQSQTLKAKKLRESLPRLEGEKRSEGLTILSANTKTKVIDGQKHYLLFRGEKERKFIDTNFKRSSWTPFERKAKSFGTVVEKWVPESKIVTIPSAYGRIKNPYTGDFQFQLGGENSNYFSSELEVIIED